MDAENTKTTTPKLKILHKSKYLFIKQEAWKDIVKSQTQRLNNSTKRSKCTN